MGVRPVSVPGPRAGGPDRRARGALTNSLENAGLTFGSAATGVAIPVLAERFGWRQSFVLTASLAIVLAGVWWWYGRNRPADHPGVNRAELALIEAGRPPAEPPEPGAWKLVLRDPQVLLLTLGYFCSNYVFYFFFNWLFIYLIESRGFRLLEGGTYAAAPARSARSCSSRSVSGPSSSPIRSTGPEPSRFREGGRPRPAAC